MKQQNDETSAIEVDLPPSEVVTNNPNNKEPTQTKTINFEPMEIGYDGQESQTLLENDQTLESKNNAMKSNIFRVDSIAIPVFYFTLGFLLSFPKLAIRFFLRDHIGATPGQQALVFSVVMGMPWNLKVFIGF